MTKTNLQQRSPQIDYKAKKILKKPILASRTLVNLSGVVKTIPDENCWKVPNLKKGV